MTEPTREQLAKLANDHLLPTPVLEAAVYLHRDLEAALPSVMPGSEEEWLHSFAWSARSKLARAMCETGPMHLCALRLASTLERLEDVHGGSEDLRQSLVVHWYVAFNRAWRL